jgi:hypothetical protein
MAAFTTIATAVGLAATAGSTGMSFAQAGKQKQAQRKAEQDATLAMDEARKKLEVNFYAQQGIKKEPYELEREALLAQGAQAIQAGVESERGAAATAGRVALGMNEAQAGIRSAMGRELTDLENKQLAEESRLQGLSAGLDLEEAKGAGQAAAAARNLSAQSMQQGMAGLASLGEQVGTALPLYQKSKAASQLQGIENQYNKDVLSGKVGVQFLDTSGKALPFQQALEKMNIPGLDLSGVGGMKQDVFKTYMADQDLSKLKDLRKTGFGYQQNFADYFNPGFPQSTQFGSQMQNFINE